MENICIDLHRQDSFDNPQPDQVNIFYLDKQVTTTYYKTILVNCY